MFRGMAAALRYLKEVSIRSHLIRLARFIPVIDRRVRLDDTESGESEYLMGCDRVSSQR